MVYSWGMIRNKEGFKEALTAYKKKLLEELPEETDCEFWMKKLTVPESDWAYGHSHGWNACLEQVKSIIERI